MSVLRFEELSRRARRRLLLTALVRTVLSTVALLLLYFSLPLNDPFSGRTAVVLILGLLLVAALVAWQAQSIIKADYPRLRAIQALSTSVPLFLLLFSATYYLLDSSQGDAFNEPLSRLDALYFTITVFATVGFGDIAAHSQPARVLVTLQMVGDLILIGLVLKVLFNAVALGLSRQPEDS